MKHFKKAVTCVLGAAVLATSVAHAGASVCRRAYNRNGQPYRLCCHYARDGYGQPYKVCRRFFRGQYSPYYYHGGRCNGARVVIGPHGVIIRGGCGGGHYPGPHHPPGPWVY